MKDCKQACKSLPDMAMLHLLTNGIEDMDNIGEILEQGRVGITTIMGMGGVFLALLCLYGFTTALGKLFSPKPSKVQAPPAKAPEPKEPREESGNEAVAAAVAVAIAIQADSQRVLPLSVQGAGSISPWKISGRRTMMRSPNRKHQ